MHDATKHSLSPKCEAGNKHELFLLIISAKNEQFIRKLTPPWEARLGATGNYGPSSNLICSLYDIVERHVGLC